MRRKDVKVGAVYLVKISGEVVQVKIEERAFMGIGWTGTNLSTGREVRIKTAGKLRKLFADAPFPISNTLTKIAHRKKLLGNVYIINHQFVYVPLSEGHKVVIGFTTEQAKKWIEQI